MSLPPSEIPLGAVRFNSDSQKLEYWIGDVWMQVKTFSPNLNGGGRGVIAGGGDYPSETNRIQYITIPTQGNSLDFGDLTQTREGLGGMSNRTRAVFSSGGNFGNPIYPTIDFVTISSTGDALDFGDYLENAREVTSAGSNQTRGLVAGGYDDPTGNNLNRIGAITFSSLGNAEDFGDLVNAVREAWDGIISTGVRGFNCGGVSPSFTDTINMITIPTFGNAVDFGNLIKVGRQGSAVGNSTRGYLMGNNGPGDTYTTEIQRFNLISGGNAVQTGDSTVTRNQTGVSDPIRGVSCGGAGAVNTMEYISLSTEGNAVDFGDLIEAVELAGSGSNSHGGLG